MGDFLVAVFHRPGEAVRTHRYLTDRGIAVAIMPSPRSACASCGLSLRFSLEQAAPVIAALKEFLPQPGIFEIYQAVRTGNHHDYVPASEYLSE
ncbi:MAG: DUF3343 domain-containing protein [Firmicutes bacterium]|nr:DUF3343 domain-containing protein [Bacillota bacterium]